MANGGEADAAQPSRAAWREIASLTYVCWCFVVVVFFSFFFSFFFFFFFTVCVKASFAQKVGRWGGGGGAKWGGGAEGGHDCLLEL